MKKIISILLIILSFQIMGCEDEDTEYKAVFKIDGVQRELITHIPYIYYDSEEEYYMSYDGEDLGGSMPESLSLRFPGTVSSGTTYDKDDLSSGFYFSYDDGDYGHIYGDGYVNSTSTLTVTVNQWSGGSLSGTFEGTLSDGSVITDGSFDGEY